MPICGSYKATLGGEDMGSLTVTRQGLSYCFEFSGGSHFGVSRLICVGGGAAASVGIPVPRGEGMYLKKTISASSLRSTGLEDIEKCLLVPPDSDIGSFARSSLEEMPRDPAPDPGQASRDGPEYEAVPSEPERGVSAGEPESAQRPPPAGAGWQRLRGSEELFSDPSLREECPSLKGALLWGSAASGSLAFPYSPDAPFPVISRFRRASSRVIGGRMHIVYELRDGAIV